MDGLDVALLVAVIADGLAGHHDAAVERGFGDVAFRPDVVQEFLLRKRAAGVLDQECEDFEDLGLKRDGDAGTTEFETGDIELELIEGIQPSPDDHGDWGSDHAGRFSRAARRYL